MTHAEQIIRAVAILVNKEGKDTFTRVAVRNQIDLSHKTWMSGYVAVFQGMRVDQPGGAPKVGKRFEKVFCRVRRGEYTLTLKGVRLIDDLK